MQDQNTASALEVSPDILQVLVSMQQVLLKSGYSYLTADEEHWPSTAVRMTFAESPLLIDVWQREPAAGTLEQWQAFALQEKNAGLLLIGNDDIHDRAVDDFFVTTRGALGYIDARTRQFRLSTLPVWVQHPPGILRELRLAEALTPHCVAQAAAVDCRAAIVRDTQTTERNRDYSTATEQLYGATRTPLTHLLILICVLVYLGTMLTAQRLSILTPTPFFFAQRMWGALDGALIRHGECWRLLTAGFVHKDLTHLVSNMLVLYFLATPLEYQQGAKRVAAFFLYSVITGFVLSLLFMPKMGAIGASGGIFGLVGVYAALPVRFHAEMPPSWRTRILQCLILILAYSVLLASLVPDIDWLSHLGGLLGGFALAMILLRSPIPHSARPRWADPRWRCCWRSRRCL